MEDIGFDDYWDERTLHRLWSKFWSEEDEAKLWAAIQNIRLDNVALTSQITGPPSSLSELLEIAESKGDKCN